MREKKREERKTKRQTDEQRNIQEERYGDGDYNESWHLLNKIIFSFSQQAELS